MCGRTCCALDPDTLCCACEYKDADGKHCKPAWAKTELEYTPSYNIGPRDILPCMVSGFHFKEKKKEERVLCAMVWGMIPPWHQGDYKQRSDKLATHNGRLESIETSKLYSPSLRKQQRCVVICEGFYEWKTTDNRSPKQPYYIYAAQSKGVKADDPTTWTNEFSEMDGWSGFRVLKLAGIFGEFTTDKGKIIHCCTIITRDSDEVLAWLHHRMPVCLNSEEDCKAWLNRDVPTDAAIKKLNNIILQEETLNWHPVSTIVNNVIHKTAECRKKIKLKEKKNSQMSFMASWLQKGSAASIKRKSTDNKDTTTSNKKGEKTSKIFKK